MNNNRKHILLEDRKSINGLEVSDCLGLMNWYEAVEVCKILGKGWRLPTIKELTMIYEHKKSFKFYNNYYWSSTQCHHETSALYCGPFAKEVDFSLYQNFMNGIVKADNKIHNFNYARAVRNC